MISNLLYKELRLAAHPNLFVFTLLGALVIVPAYPYGMVFLFGCLAPYITFMYGRETNDIYYTALLPVKKRDTVKAKCLLMVLAQLAQLAISLPFAILRVSVLPNGNPAGIEANVAYYGFGLMIYAVFNVIFLTQFFGTAHKVGKAFLLAVIPATLGVVAMEVLVHFPVFYWLDGVSAEEMVRQLPILIIGIAIYVIGILLAYRVSAKRFEQVDL
ncbi:ABC-2 family transporter [Mobilisporobacter senegalensis]|uniref:ABC-2 family transporter n=1 Tax=Mobilisporobacter senegalensis TaxID=1329262 RepID=A0A3N1XGX6_9FIRM|nr:ABC-2 transporter permease [Mobilisporobacter senegalensis]ROR25905.1 ABC-2 family transporter [Mobilisporobacter senegalensis]